MVRIRFLWYLLLIIPGLGCRADSDPEAAENRTQETLDVYPIVDVSQEQLFGASRNGEWLPAEQAAEEMRPGQEYRVFGLTEALTTITAAAPKPPPETCTNPTVPLRDLPDRGGDLMAVTGSWNPLPRVPVVQDPVPDVYENVLADHLRERDIEPGDVSIDQVLRIDLEGDGTEEVLVTAHRLRGSATMAVAGDYAVVLLRKLLDGEVHTIPLEEEYYPEECIAECTPSSYRVAAVLDLNGDGSMEVVTKFRYFEGEGKRIHAVRGRETTPVLSWRCGV